MKKIVKRYLELSKFSNQKSSFEELFLSHPNYPSLYAITDSLTLLGIENIAARVSKDYFFDLPISILAFYKEEFVLVERFDNGVYITKDDSRRNLITFDTFFNDWNGIVLAIEENKNQIKPNKIKGLSKYFFLFIGLLIFYIFNNNQNFHLTSIFGFLLSIIGFILGVIIIEEKYGSNENSIVSKFCSFSESTSCNSVLESSKTTISKWLDFSDMPIVFFATATISQLLNEQIVFMVSIMSVVALPLVAYSIWLQKVEIKKWCVLCLAVSTILLLLSIIQLINTSRFPIKTISDFFVIGAIVITIWFFLKHYLNSNSILVKENLDLKKFKRNPILFNSLLKPLCNYDALQLFNKISIGKKRASINLTLILSPSCSHCHTAYKEALELYKNFQDKINITVLFNVNPNNKQNKYLEVIYTMLYINKINPNKIIEALNDWHIKRMTLENWLDKWNKVTDDFVNESKDLLLQYEWCQANNFNFTPVKLLNDNIYPTEYSVGEIKYFISEFEEEIEKV